MNSPSTVLKEVAMLIILLVVSIFSDAKAQTDVGAVINNASRDKILFSNFLDNFISSTLAGEDVFFLLDPKVGQFIDLDSMTNWAASSLQSYLIMTWDEVRNSSANKYYLRSSTMIMFVIYHQDPSNFLDAEETRSVWNPKYQVFLRLNADIDSYKILRHKVVQRSVYIASVELKGVVRPRFLVYQMSHIIPGKGEKSGAKTNLGAYSKETFKNKEAFFGEVHFDLAGGNLGLASWCDDKPFIHIYPPKPECEGVSLDILSIIAEKYKFTYDVQLETADGRWGSKENGTWTGMLADLIYNGKHLVINYFLLTADRYSDFDTTYPYFSEGFGFVLRNPPPLPEWLGLFYPFTPSVWILFLCTTTIMAILLTTVLALVRDTQPYDTSFLLVSKETFMFYSSASFLGINISINIFLIQAWSILMALSFQQNSTPAFSGRKIEILL